MLNRAATLLQIWLTTTVPDALRGGPPGARVGNSPTETDEPDRGDVPGWVMITMMTAIVVIALLAVFRDAVVNAVTNAFNSISGKS
jgi:hypothetical protein